MAHRSRNAALRWLKKIENQFNELESKYGYVNRLAAVCYPSGVAYGREVPTSISHPTLFGNAGGSRTAPVASLNFAEHGRHILPDPETYATRIATDS